MDTTKQVLRASAENDLPQVQKLVAGGARVDVRDEHGHSPVAVAAREGSIELLQWLLEQGADADALGCNNHPAIVYATLAGHLTAVDLLLRFGANPNRARPHGGETAVHAAAIGRHTEIVQRLVQAGGQVNVHTAKHVESDLLWNVLLTSDTPLHVAACYGEPFMVACLLELGANPRLENYRQETPLASALRMRRPLPILRPLRGHRYAEWSDNLPVPHAWAG